MTLTIHRGTRQIGGSCVEITGDNSRIIIDIGFPLSGLENDENFLEQDISKLIEKEIIPDVKGFYNMDQSIPKVDAVLISHPHIDHYGFFSLVDKDIPIYCGNAAKKIIEGSVLFSPRLKGSVENFKPFISGKEFYIKDIKITPLLMDHSAYDSYAFLIESEGKKILYSGDFRTTGRKKGIFSKYFQNITDVDVLILEGTNIAREPQDLKSETALESEITEIIKNSDALIFFVSSPQNIDRVVTLYKACRKTGRTLVINPYIAYILDCINNPNIPNISTFSSIKSLYYEKYLDKIKSVYKNLYEEIGRKIVKKEKIMKTPQNYLIFCQYNRKLKSLIDKALEKNVSVKIIYSQWSGYLEINEYTKELTSFIKNHNIEIIHKHISGHASVTELKRFAEIIKPKTIIPIHTKNPELFKNYFDNVKVLDDGEMFII